MYAQRQRKIVQGDNPDLSNADVSRLLGEHWRNAKIEQKRPFLEREKAERKIYKAKTEAFKNNLKYFKANKKSQKSPEQLLGEWYLGALRYPPLPMPIFCCRPKDDYIGQ